MATDIAALQQEVEQEGGGTEEIEKARIEIGGRIVFGVIGLIVLAGIGIFYYANFTEPLSAQELKTLGADDFLDRAEELHTAWFNEIKDLGQLYIISLLIPVLTTLIGYIFGKAAASTSEP